MLRTSPLLVSLWGIIACSVLYADNARPAPPNIVLVITDDQGYGDLGCTGNPIARTPHIDRLAAESSQLSDYHVAPTCSPTRAALLTGHWTDRTGVWHTVNGRSMLREDEVTLAELLRRQGYATGLFGKWHLGDNYPYRPEDRGFTEVYRHGGGGVGQTPDVWDNAYFDGHYFHNGEIVAAKGFCTDVFFEQSRMFIQDCVSRQQPFFAYITTNAPHGPLHAPQHYMDMYADQPKAIAAFYGMIKNIDDNVGQLRELLRKLDIADNTLFIFTTDNGTATGSRIFNAGMRGAKGSEYDGGHRVPFFAHWPAAGWNCKHVNDTLCHAVDIVPTLLEIAGAKAPPELKFDGISLRRLLDPAAETTETSDWPERMLVTDSQRVRDPIKWKQTAVMSQQWRLVNNNELYRIKEDPGQERNVITEYPEQATRMREFYDAWWAELEPTFARTTRIYLGHPEHPVVSLTGHDWIQEELPPWNQGHIRQAHGLPGKKGNPQNKAASNSAAEAVAVHRGHWAVKWVQAGEYEIRVLRWPMETNTAITAGLPAAPNVPGATMAYRAQPGVAVPITEAILRIDGREIARLSVGSDESEVRFKVNMTAGEGELSPVFRTGEGSELGAYYTVVERLHSN